MAARRKISVKLLCKLGTLAHNRAFTPRDLAEYTGNIEGRGNRAGTIQSLIRRGVIRKVSGGAYYPTAKGWKVIDRSCNLAWRQGGR